MKLASRVVCLVAVALLLSIVPAHAADWTPLGEATVDFHTDSVSIAATSGAGAFSKLSLEVTKNVLQIETVKVTTADGKKFSVELNKFVGAGNSSVIDFPSPKEIQKVEFTYHKAKGTGNGNFALVKILGSV